MRYYSYTFVKYSIPQVNTSFNILNINDIYIFIKSYNREVFDKNN